MYEIAAARILSVVTEDELMTQRQVGVLARMDSSRCAMTLARMVAEGRLDMRERRDGKPGRPAYLYRRVRTEAA